jgi:hypothetical protein
MKTITRLVLALVLTIASLSYGCGSKEPVKGETLDWDKIADNSMVGKTVTIEGYPELPMLMLDAEGRSTLNLHRRMNQYSGGMIILSVKDGDDENTMKTLPDDYETSDLLIHDMKGQNAVYGDKIRVTGKATFENGKYHIEVEQIEKVEETFDYAKEAVRLTDSSDFEALDGKIVFAEGELYVTDEQESGIRMDVWLDDTTLAYGVMCKLPYGPLKNQANELPESYESADVVIRDNSGKKVTDGGRIRVYGMWRNEAELIAVEKIEAQ